MPDNNLNTLKDLTMFSDSYDFHSKKDYERKRRLTQAQIQLSNVLENTQHPVDMNMFWGSSKKN